MKNKKGFTLIELLAVIVILAIIALIAVPIILNMVEKSKYKAAESSALGYIDAINYNNDLASMNNEYNGYNPTPTGNGIDVSEINAIIKMKGKKPTSGTVNINSAGRVTGMNIVIGGYIVTSTDGKIVTVGEKASGGSATPKTIGEEVSFGTQDFYVLWSNENQTALLSKYSLDISPTNINEIVQNESNAICSSCTKAFAETAYWDDGTGNLKSNYAFDLNGNAASYSGNPYPYVYDSNSILYPYIEGYINNLKANYNAPNNISGRVPSYEEIYNINNNTMFGTSFLNDKSGFTGSAIRGSLTGVWFLNNSTLANGTVGRGDAGNRVIVAVVIVSTSDI